MVFRGAGYDTGYTGTGWNQRKFNNERPFGLPAGHALVTSCGLELIKRSGQSLHSAVASDNIEVK